MIRKLLVANRGEIASRVIRTARERDIATAAVFSEPDADAPFVAEADEAVALPGAAPADTYLRADLIIAAARAVGADAVHPGYGFLSENAGFARACAEADLVFVGPPMGAIESMGSKITAKELMARAGVPVLPGVTVDPADDLDAAGASVGFPLLVKASAGGGGRGMRIVHAPGELADAVEGARREAASAFGDGTVFLERYLTDPRHVEVQILGDTHGTVVHLHERECSIQRRYQKIIEEAPSPAVDESLRAELGAAAVAAAKAIGYVGAATVEFVLDTSSQDATPHAGRARAPFHFLEVNTRLQVEHPVTELVTGLDLVALQLLVADGEPLPEQATTAAITGHAVEARLYAEDVAAGFLPVTGTLARFSIPALPGVRVDAGVADGSVISPHYDPMLAKVIAHGANRDEACRRLARALAEAQLHGLTTNRDLLVGVLREPGFRAGHTDTGYLTRHDPVALGTSAADPAVVGMHAAAAALADQAARRADAPVLATLPSGWRNVPNELQHAVFAHGDDHIEVRYALVSAFGGQDPRKRSRAARIEVDGVELDGVVVRRATPERVDLDVAGVRRSIRVHRVADVAYVDSALGATTLTEVPRFPEPGTSAPSGSLLAPMPGTVVRVAVEAGEHVAAGTAVVVLEAMKMEHTVAAPHEGVVSEVNTEVGATVDTGTVLAVVEEQEGDR